MKLGGVVSPSDLDVDSRGRVYVADPTANHVYRLDAAGKVAVRMGATDGQKEGHYDPGTFMKPTRVATWTDEEGKDCVLVMESAGLGRTTEWSSEGAMIREWQGLMTRANDGWVADPEAPSDVYVLGHDDYVLRFKVDYISGKWTCDAVWPGIVGGKKLGGSGDAYPSIAHVGGRKYLTFGRGYAVYRFEGDRLLASAGLVIKGKQQGRKEYVWSDRNGDGNVQDEEVSAEPLARPAGIYGYWGDCWQQDLSLVAVAEGTRDIWRLAPEGFDTRGNPIYKTWQKVLSDPVMAANAAGTADVVHGGNEIATVFDCAWRSVVGTPEKGWITDIRTGSLSANHGTQQKITRYIPDGQGKYKMLWRVGRSANIQGGPGAVIGSIWASEPAYDLVGVVDQTLAGVHVFTLDEGLYVDTLLCDGSKQLTNIYGSPGEFFAGRVYLNKDDGKVYIAWGKTTPMLFEVDGWSKDAGIRHVTGLPASVTLTSDRIAEPPEMAIKVRGGAGKAKVAQILPATGGAPSLDGSLAGWEACRPVVYGEGAKQVEVRCAYDPETLYLRWQVRSDAVVSVRPAEPVGRLFTHDRGADTVGFYWQGEEKVTGTAVAGRKNDLRIVCGIFDVQGTPKPLALGMYPSYAGKGNAVTYGSPVGKTAFEHVGLVDGAVLGHVMDKDQKGFVIAVAIPRKALPGALVPLAPGLRTMINFDVNFGGNKKMWWSIGDGSASRETNDEPTEARLYPGSWAPAALQSLSEGLVVRRWQVIGPFGFAALPTLDHREGRVKICAILNATAYPPEKKIDLEATYTGDETRTRSRSRTLKWTPVANVEEAVKLSEVKGINWTGNEDEGAVYMATWIYAPAVCKVKLAMIEGHGHNGTTGWLNDLKLPTTGDAKQLKQRIDTSQSVQLKAGWNQLLLRFDHVWGDTSLGLRIEAPPQTLWGLKVSATPPAAR